MNRKKINRLRFSRLLAVAAAILRRGSASARSGSSQGAALKIRQTALGSIVVDSRGRTALHVVA
jgi:hypothetical protein